MIFGEAPGSPKNEPNHSPATRSAMTSIVVHYTLRRLHDDLHEDSPYEGKERAPRLIDVEIAVGMWSGKQKAQQNVRSILYPATG